MTVTVRTLALALLLGVGATPQAADEKELPAALSKDQKANLLKFLSANEKPDRYVPKGATYGDLAPPAADVEVTASKDKPIRQYTVQITPHRPVPDEPAVGKADVYFYRPNPEKGKQGITVKYTIDLATGQPVGAAEVLTKAHTPVSRAELAEAVAAAREKSPAVKALYEGKEPGMVRWEYLQMKINRKTDRFEPGDRVVRIVFTAAAADGKEPTPVRVLVNLTKDAVTADER